MRCSLQSIRHWTNFNLRVSLCRFDGNFNYSMLLLYMPKCAHFNVTNWSWKLCNRTFVLRKISHPLFDSNRLYWQVRHFQLAHCTAPKLQLLLLIDMPNAYYNKSHPNFIWHIVSQTNTAECCTYRRNVSELRARACTGDYTEEKTQEILQQLQKSKIETPRV